MVAPGFGPERRGAVVGDATVDGVGERGDVTALHVGPGRRRVVAVVIEVDRAGDTTERDRHQYSSVNPSASSASWATVPVTRAARSGSVCSTRRAPPWAMTASLYVANAR